MQRPRGLTSSLCVLVCLLVGVSSAEGQYILSGDEAWDQTFHERWERLKNLAQKGKFRDSLKEVIWLLDNRPGSFPEFENSPTKVLMDYAWHLHRYYRPAEKLMKKRRASMEKAFLAGKGDYGKGHELHEINKHLGDWNRTLELYDQLVDQEETDKRMLRELFLYVEEALLEEDRFEELLTAGGRGPGSLEARKAKLDTHILTVRNISEETIDTAKTMLCRSAARHYQAMLATGKKKEAARLADRYLTYREKGRTYVFFIRHAVQAKKYNTARKLVKRAEETLSKEQYAEVKKEAKHIPKKKKKKKKRKKQG